MAVMRICRECGKQGIEILPIIGYLQNGIRYPIIKPATDERLQSDGWIIAGRYILCPKCREREWPVGDYARTPKIRMKISESLKASWRRKHGVMA